MNIYRHELRSLKKSALLWMCALTALAAVYLSVYPSVARDAAEFKKLLEAYPQQVRAILGISLDAIASLPGFYAMTFSFISLLGGVQAMNLGLSVLSRETREKTADFLLVKPVSRFAVVGTKLLAAVSVLLATNIVYDAASFFLAGLAAAGDFDGKLFLLINITLFLIQLIFLSVGLVLSVVIPKFRSVLPASLGVVFGLYFIGAFLYTGGKDIARYFSPFLYFNSSYIIAHSAYEAPYPAVGAAVVAVAVAASFFIYARKDIRL